VNGASGLGADVEKTGMRMWEMCRYEPEATMFFVHVAMDVLRVANPWARYDITRFQADPAMAFQHAGPGIGIFVAAATDQPHPVLSDLQVLQPMYGSP